MELLSGESMATRLARGPFAFVEILDLFAESSAPCRRRPITAWSTAT